MEKILKRMFVFLEEREWEKADEYAERALDIDLENAVAYIGKLMAELKVCRQEDLAKQEILLDENKNYQKACRYADQELKKTLEGYNETIRVRIAIVRKNNAYKEACKLLKNNTLHDIEKAENILMELGDWEASVELLENIIPVRREQLKCEMEEQERQRQIKAMKRRKYALITCAIAAGIALVVTTGVIIGANIEKKKEAADLKARGYCEMELSDDRSYYIVTGAENHSAIAIPDTYKGKPVKEIGESAFSKCDNLISVEIPDSVTNIGEFAFIGCSILKNVEIPDGVTSIGRAAFFNCTGLTNIEIGGGVTSIGDSAFYNCSSLTSIEIPDSVKSIERCAFWACSGLTYIKIGATNIGEYAFDSCIGLTSIVLSDNVRSIEQYAFRNCSALMSVEISKNVSSIGANIFYNCDKLTSITFEDSSTWYFTYNPTDWENKTGGEEIDVTCDLLDCFKSFEYFWYKL